MRVRKMSYTNRECLIERRSVKVSPTKTDVLCVLLPLYQEKVTKTGVFGHLSIKVNTIFLLFWSFSARRITNITLDVSPEVCSKSYLKIQNLCFPFRIKSSHFLFTFLLKKFSKNGRIVYCQMFLCNLLEISYWRENAV